MTENEVISAFMRNHPEYLKEISDEAKEEYSKYLQKLYDAGMIPLYLYKQSKI